MRTELDIPVFVNDRYIIRKRNAERRAKRFREILENALKATINAGLVIGGILMFAGCSIIDNPANDPTIGKPWGYLIGGLMLVTINAIIKYSIEED